MQMGKTTLNPKGFVMLNRGEDTVDLMKDPNAYTLLSSIAYRARRNNEPNIKNLKTGEALIGDWRSIGLTESKYRSAKKRLDKYGLATFKGTKRGTIAKLTDTRIFDINEENKNGKPYSKTTDDSRPNQRLTRSKKRKRKKEEINKGSINKEDTCKDTKSLKDISGESHDEIKAAHEEEGTGSETIYIEGWMSEDEIKAAHEKEGTGPGTIDIKDLLGEEGYKLWLQQAEEDENLMI
jgi:hypothetical protein